MPESIRVPVIYDHSKKGSASMQRKGFRFRRGLKFETLAILFKFPNPEVWPPKTLSLRFAGTSMKTVNKSRPSTHHDDPSGMGSWGMPPQQHQAGVLTRKTMSCYFHTEKWLRTSDSWDVICSDRPMCFLKPSERGSRLTDHPMRNLDELEYKHSDITKNIYNQQWPLGYSQPSFV